MNKVLVIGSGGRCDAICKKIKESDLVDLLFCAPGNAGIARYAVNIPIKVDDIDGLAEFAYKENINLTIVGPEASLSKGIVDKFQNLGLKIFGPTKAATSIESSKSYAKELMKKYNIPTASYEVFSDYDEALKYIEGKKLPIVLKYDGLAAGKGVIIAKTMEEAKTNLYEMLVNKEFGDDKVVIEDFLEGEEFSYMCFVIHYYKSGLQFRFPYLLSRRSAPVDLLHCLLNPADCCFHLYIPVHSERFGYPDNCPQLSDTR